MEKGYATASFISLCDVRRRDMVDPEDIWFGPGDVSGSLVGPCMGIRGRGFRELRCEDLRMRFESLGGIEVAISVFANAQKKIEKKGGARQLASQRQQLLDNSKSSKREY